MSAESFKRLAERLDQLPNGFPKTEDGSELRLLAKIFSAEEAELAARLRLTLETPGELGDRIGEDQKVLTKRLKTMARKGLISWGKTDQGPGYGLMPFVVGIYEMQIGRMDEELAVLFEEYYRKGFANSLQVEPQVHRVIPIGESVRTRLEIKPYESASQLVHDAHAWGVIDCICRTQKALIGDPCEHPVDVCLVMSNRSGAFDHNPVIEALTEAEALATLRRAANAGLVHSVSNNQRGLSYICNCCTCSCGILRGMADMGIANVVAKSSFVNQVDEELCISCGDCVESCQFDALSLNGTIAINKQRCVGCGVCALNCPESALGLVARPDGEVLVPPESETDWRERRAEARRMDLNDLI